MIYTRLTERKDLLGITSLVLSDADLREIELTCGLDPDEAILLSVEESLKEGNLCYTLFSETSDTLEGFYGLCLHENKVGVPWLLSSRIIADYPIKFLKGSKEFLKECDSRCDFMTQVIDPQHTVAKQWLKWLGFKFMVHPSREDLEMADRVNLNERGN